METIYKKFVTHDNDLVGQIAYSYYIKDRIYFINTFKDDEGREPNSTDYNSFEKYTATNKRIEEYKENARRFLAEVNTIFLKQELKNRPEYKKSSFWWGFFQSILASFIWTLILALIIVILWASNIGLKKTIQLIFFNEKAKTEIEE